MSTRNLIFAIAAALALTFTVCDNGITDQTDLIVTWPADLTASRGQKLADISLAAYTNDNTGTFAWDSPDHPAGASFGAHPHSMTFTPNDRSKYNAIKKNVNVRVSLAEMVRITGGTYTMGSPPNEQYRENNEAQVNALIDDFYLGKYEVTQAQWYEIMETTIEDQQALADIASSADYGRGDNRPIYYVSWYDALVFCNRLSALEGLTPAYRIDDETDPDWWGDIPTEYKAEWSAVEIVAGSNGYRLPDEAQWEYACRAGTTTPWYSGETDENLGDYAWYVQNNGRSGTPEYGAKPVGAKKPNDFGLYDMHGNVCEWCWDRCGIYPVLSDPLGVWITGNNFRMIRGNSWNYPARYQRSAFRDFHNQFSRNFRTGFRLMRPAE